MSVIQVQIVDRITGMQSESRWSFGDVVHQHIGVKTHHSVGLSNLGPGGFQDGARLGQRKLTPVLGKHL